MRLGSPVVRLNAFAIDTLCSGQMESRSRLSLLVEKLPQEALSVGQEGFGNGEMLCVFVRDGF